MNEAIEYLRAIHADAIRENERLTKRIIELEAENAELKGKTIAVSDTMIHGSRAEHRSCPRDGTKMIASQRRDGITYTCPGCGQKEVVLG